MDTYLHSITKSPSDKSWMRARIVERIPRASVIYIDPSFSSDLMLYLKPWEAMILRPVTQYEYRLLHALLRFGLNQIDELISLFKEKNPFTFGTVYRPRILTSVSDAELVAHAASTAEVSVHTGCGVARYKTRQKKIVNVDKVVASIVRANKVLSTTDLHIVPPKSAFPQHLVGSTDITILNMNIIPKNIFIDYMDKLSIEGKLVMVIGGYADGESAYSSDYNVDTFSRERGADVHIIRNYQI